MYRNHGPGPLRCRIIVRGSLSEANAATLEDMTLEAGGGLTTLEGDLVDQAQVYGVLDRLRDFGLELVHLSPVEH